MKHLLIIAVMAGFISCTQVTGNDASKEPLSNQSILDQNQERNKTIVNNYMNAYLKGDSKSMAALMTDDYKGYGLGVNDLSNKAKTLESVDKHWENYKYGGKRFQAIETIAITTNKDGGRGRPAGDWILVWGDMETDYPSTPEYGNKAVTAKFTHHAAYRVNKEGKIDISCTYFNHEDIMKQLGYKYLSVVDQKRVADKKLDYK
ncbi:nuclear transport factor 2 family protein [Sediminibacterium sp.]|uniref:nuclear transport factor 2 family protein n=1 Tax=Sediminibacterium sp. TaxID=1917865 RepID=UPI0025CCFEEF|nr:nuclear transport factor 2 family protein [Sediminibacterium sp.]MBT9484382.1 nuclear transport factor 2 family protein [Sediminibacterium sp.]